MEDANLRSRAVQANSDLKVRASEVRLGGYQYREFRKHRTVPYFMLPVHTDKCRTERGPAIQTTNTLEWLVFPLNLLQGIR